MPSKTVYQIDRSGHYLGPTQADESPLEPGTYHLPLGTIEAVPPESWPDHQWPRWNGHAWELITRPVPPAEPTATEKLAAFLLANPDVAALVTPPTP